MLILFYRQIEKNAEELTADCVNTENMEAECIMAGEDQDLNKITEDMKSLWVEKYAPKKYTELLSEEVSAFHLVFFF